MDETPNSRIAPGWYPDPVAPGTLRWWDGQQWSAHTTELNGDAPTPAERVPRGAAGKPNGMVALFAQVPAVVTVGVGLWVVAGLLAILGPIWAYSQMNDMLSLGRTGQLEADALLGAAEGFTRRANTTAYAPLIVLGVLSMLGYALCSYFVLRGSQAARIVAYVLSALSVIVLIFLTFAGVGLAAFLQLALTIGGTICISLPAASGFFAVAGNERRQAAIERYQGQR